MTDSAVYLQPAFILQQRNSEKPALLLMYWPETLAEFPCWLKGKKAKSKTAGLLQPFIPLTMSFLASPS